MGLLGFGELPTHDNIETMIGALTGLVTHKFEDRIIVQPNGVGYEVFVPLSSLSKISTGEEVELFTHLYVREDIFALYGFSTIEGIELFRLLISVSGVGPKTALGVLSSATPEDIKTAVAQADKSVFSAVSGIGKKTSGRIILELQSKLGELEELDLRREPQKEEAVEALRNLGYSKSEAVQALKDVDGQLPSEEQLQEALRNLGR